MSDDPIGFVLFLAGIFLLVGLLIFLIVLNHSRNKQAKMELYKLYNVINDTPTFDVIQQQIRLMQNSAYMWTWNLYNTYANPELETPPSEPPPKTDQDFIRFGYRSS